VMNSTDSKDNNGQFMQAALAEARKAYDLGEVPVGAVAVFKGEILVQAHNYVETLKDASAHAEMLVLKKTAAFLDRWRLDDIDIYVTIEPCPMCAMAMVLYRVNRLVYGAPEPRTGAAGSFINLVQNPTLNHQMEVVSGVCADESSELMQSFFRKKRSN